MREKDRKSHTSVLGLPSSKQSSASPAAFSFKLHYIFVFTCVFISSNEFLIDRTHGDTDSAFHPFCNRDLGYPPTPKPSFYAIITPKVGSNSYPQKGPIHETSSSHKHVDVDEHGRDASSVVFR
ncbi:hypothetical protein OF83DRAFT_1175816 [Amylostereum chailletii]|nr:hypothetical protein OF83DRAFT_1175816 [Amylostereum chailletii]